MTKFFFAVALLSYTTGSLAARADVYMRAMKGSNDPHPVATPTSTGTPTTSPHASRTHRHDEHPHDHLFTGEIPKPGKTPEAKHIHGTEGSPSRGKR